jgi:uncharacterized glyoxalase superfamily protein PhnB
VARRRVRLTALAVEWADVARRRSTDGFAVLRWAEAYLFVAELSTRAPLAEMAMHVRVIVDDVEAVFRNVSAIGVTIERAIQDRGYGLRDFVVVDPDGFGIRFAQPIDR